MYRTQFIIVCKLRYFMTLTRGQKKVFKGYDGWILNSLSRLVYLVLSTKNVLKN